MESVLNKNYSVHEQFKDSDRSDLPNNIAALNYTPLFQK